MNTKEIYINGILIDLDEANNPIQLTYSINDLGELKDRQAYSTSTFKIPKTQNNLLACGFPDDPNLIQLQPYRKNTAKIVQDGVEILPNAIALIDGTDANINVQILSGLYGFFDSLADKKISDLDLSEYDHIWDISTVSNSQVNTDGFIYPVIDYGGLGSTERRADARQLRPATFRKTIIEKIAEEAGYTLTGLALSYPKYLNSIIPFTNDKFTHGKDYADEISTYKTSARKTVAQALNPSPTTGVILFQDDATTDQYGQWDGTVFTSQKPIRGKITLNYNIEQVDIFTGGSSPQVFINIDKKIGGTFQTIAQNVTTSTAAVGTIERFNDQQVSIIDDINIGDQFRISYLLQPAANRVFAGIDAGANITFEPIAEDVTYGSEVQLSATLPDITQKNFFKDFLQNFGLIAIPDPYKKEVLLINMEEVYDNKPNAEDITDKLVNSVDKVSYSFSNYGINNYGRYKEDDAVTDGLGDGVMVFDNRTLDENVDLFTSVFSASQSVSKQSLEIIEIKKIEDILISSEFKTKTQPRILLDRKISTQYTFFDGLGSTVVNSISLPTFNGLSYVDLFAENYPELLRMLYRAFVVEKQIMLKEIDIAKIDWTIPVYDKKTASYYYKNSIKYIQNGVSTINLIRMP